MASELKYNYYVMDVPEDVGTLEERSDIAINTAREQARLWAVPCEWAIVKVSGDLLTVRRIRRV